MAFLTVGHNDQRRNISASARMVALSGRTKKMEIWLS